MHMKRTADRDYSGMIFAGLFGRWCQSIPSCCTSRYIRGENVRVGLEDSLWAGRGELATSNAVQVRKSQKHNRKSWIRNRNPQRSA